MVKSEKIQWAPDIQQDRNSLAPKLSWSKPSRFFSGVTLWTMCLESIQILLKIWNLLLMILHMPWTQILSRRCAALPDQDLKKWGLSEEAILNNFKLMNPNYVTIIMIFMNVWMNEWMNEIKRYMYINLVFIMFL